MSDGFNSPLIILGISVTLPSWSEVDETSGSSWSEVDETSGSSWTEVDESSGVA